MASKKISTKFIPHLRTGYEENEFTNFQKKIKEILNTYSEIEKVFSHDFYTHDKETYHFISKILKGSDPIEKVFYDILLRTIYQAESISANAASFSFAFALSFLDELGKNSSQNIVASPKELEQLEAFTNRIKERCESISEHMTPDDLSKTIKSICHSNPDLAEVIEAAVYESGLEGKIFVEEGSQPNYSIESKVGFSFSLEHFPFFFEGNLNRIWDRKDVKLVLIDGIIERVSEIDHVLTKAYDTKQPVLIISHGFAEEVIGTCLRNMQLGNLDVMLMTVKSDVNSVNVVNDIAIVTNAQPITHLYGNLVSLTPWEEFEVVDRIICSPKETTFIPAKTTPGLNNHIKNLISKRHSQSMEELRNITDERLRTLVAHSVVIRLPNLPSINTKESKVLIDIALRQIKTVMNYGTLNLSDVLSEIRVADADELEPAIHGSFLRAFERATSLSTFNTMPTLSLILSIMLCGKAALMFYSASGTTVPDRKAS